MSRKIRSFDDFLALFPESPREKISNGWNVICPAHSDRKPSLSVTLNQNRILTHCKAGCSTENVVKAMGFTMADLFINTKPLSDKRIAAVYPYKDIEGKTIFEVIRYEPKDFRIRRPDGKGGHIWNLEGIKPFLYHLPDIIRAKEYGDPIYLVEGEKDADNLMNLGLVATTNPMGAGKWHGDYSRTLEGADIRLVPQTDKAGIEHGLMVIEELDGKVANLKVIDLPETVKDVSEWLAQGNDLKSLDKFLIPPLTYTKKYTCISSGTKQGLASNRDKIGTENGTATPDTIEKTGQEGESLAQRILAWVEKTTGWWSNAELDNELGIRTTADKDNRKHILSRLTDKGIIENHPTQNRLHRYINIKVEALDFKSSRGKKSLTLKWPFGLENYVDIYPGSLAVIAGSPNSGKTAFLLNFIFLNQDNYPFFYFCSEMGSEELASRLEKFDDIALDAWKFEAKNRSSDFADVIRPDCINIIDYMELTTDLFMVNNYLTTIQHKLGSGIAIVALQKKIGAYLGRGSEFSMEKPKLYLSMDEGKLRIVKAKIWHNKEVNPNGMIAKFRIENGCDFIIHQPLRHGD